MTAVVRTLRELYPALLVLVLVYAWAWQSAQVDAGATGGRKAATLALRSEAGCVRSLPKERLAFNR